MSVDVDLVIMSKASTLKLRDMTQNAINTACFGALPEHIVYPYVMEQMQVDYDLAETIYAPGEFNYNAFANHAAKLGDSEWIVFANNDLMFTDGWLEALLRVDYPVCSPVNPGYHRMRATWRNETGWEVGRHLAGWCFIMKRSLWESLGGLDETYPFYCADNAVMDQLRDKGIPPMLVSDSVVIHNVSATLMREPLEVQDELTWAGVHRYNEASEHKTCEHHPGYLGWKWRNNG